MATRIRITLLCVLALAAARAARAAPAAPPSPVVVIFDTIRPNDTERETAEPVLRVFADGRIRVINPWDKEEKPAEVRLKPERLLRLMNALTADLAFMELREKALADAVAAEQQRRRTPTAPEGAPVTVVTVYWAGRRNTVSWPAMRFYAANFGELKPIRRFATVCRLLRTLRLETLAGGPAAVRAALEALNARLAGEATRSKKDKKDERALTRRRSARSVRRPLVRLKTTDLIHVERGKRNLAKTRIIEEIFEVPRSALTREQLRALPDAQKSGDKVLLVPKERLGERPINLLVFRKIVRGRHVLRVDARAEVDAETGEVISTAVSMTRPF